jgi:hypothetical protein
MDLIAASNRVRFRKIRPGPEFPRCTERAAFGPKVPQKAKKSRGEGNCEGTALLKIVKSVYKNVDSPLVAE